MLKRIIRKYIWPLIYALSAIFIIYYGVSNWHIIRSLFTIHTLPLLLLSILLNFGAFVSMGLAWCFMVRRHHPFVPFWDVLRTFYISQITRYTPGNVWSFLARYDNNKKLGVKYAATTYYLAIEHMSLAFTACLASLFSLELLHIGNYLGFVFAGVVICLASGIFFFRQDLFRKLVNIFARKFKKEIDYSELTKVDICIVFLFFVLYWILFGLSFYAAYYALTTHVLPVFLALGINAIAWLIGYLSLLTPSGLGVREGIFIVLLKGFVSLPTAISLAIISRLIFTLAEVLGLIGVIGIQKIISQRTILPPKEVSDAILPDSL